MPQLWPIGSLHILCLEQKDVLSLMASSFVSSYSFNHLAGVTLAEDMLTSEQVTGLTSGVMKPGFQELIQKLSSHVQQTKSLPT